MNNLPLSGESISDQWIPLTIGQWCGKLFHVTASSCSQSYMCYILFPGMYETAHISSLFCIFWHTAIYRNTIGKIGQKVMVMVRYGDGWLQIYNKPSYCFKANTMDADPLAPCVTRPSDAMLLTMLDTWVFVFENEDFNIPHPQPPPWYKIWFYLLSLLVWPDHQMSCYRVCWIHGSLFLRIRILTSSLFH